MDTPRETNLYRQIAKDYSPKQAEMKICKYIEGLERRIALLEAAAVVAEKPARRPKEQPSLEEPAKE